MPIKLSSDALILYKKLRAYRMAGAGQLLHADPGVKLTAVCAAVGCHDPVQFIRDFKAQHGMTPAKCKRVNPSEQSSGNTSS